jgi:hypothetical protein
MSSLRPIFLSMSLVTLLIVSLFTGVVTPSTPAQATTPSVCVVGESSGVVTSKITVGGIEYCLVQFTTSGSRTWTVPTGIKTADVLVVGGGGGGVSRHGGGGGGGGIVHAPGYSLDGVSSVNVTVGAGGGSDQPGGLSSFLAGTTGLQGLGGGPRNFDNPNVGSGAGSNSGEPGNSGGSSAQASAAQGFMGSVKDTTLVRYGNNGGTGVGSGFDWCWAGGGGGGAGAVGGNGNDTPRGDNNCRTSGGNGGAGVQLTITGGNVYYGAGGGGGGGVDPNASAENFAFKAAGGEGGTGGGGKGGTLDNGSNATGVGAGGGGGAFDGTAGAFGTNRDGGSGSPGTVVVRYQIPVAPSTTNPSGATIDAGTTVTVTATVTRPSSGATSYVWQRLVGATWTDIAGSGGTHTDGSPKTVSFVSPELKGPDSGTQYRLKAVNTTDSGNIAEVFSSAATITVNRKTPTLAWVLPESQTDPVLADSDFELDGAETSSDGVLGYSVTDAGDTGCQIDGRRLTFETPGSCTLQAQVPQTDIFSLASVTRVVTIEAGDFGISSPGARITATSGTFFPLCVNSCEISGFAASDSVDVIIDAGGGTVRLGDLNGIALTPLTGFPEADWADEGSGAIGFSASQSVANQALQTLEVRRSASGAPVTLRIDAELTGGSDIKVAFTEVSVEHPPPPALRTPRSPRSERPLETSDGPLGISIRPPGFNTGPTLGTGAVPNPSNALFRIPGDSFNAGDGHRSFLNGQPSAIFASQLDNSTISFGAGRLQMTMGLDSATTGGGVDSRGPGGQPLLRVPMGGVTKLAGGGMQPGSFASLWLPVTGQSPISLGQIAVDSAGRFSGSVTLSSNDLDSPLPIGRQFLQLSGIDEAGNPIVVDVVVMIGQGNPSPEILIETGLLPALSPEDTLGMANGVPTELSQTRDDLTGMLTLSTGEWAITVSPPNGQTGGFSTGASGGIVLDFDSGLAVTGSGFMGATRSDVWVFSTPIFLGSFDVDDQGNFAGTVAFSQDNLAPGNHTLQIQAVGVNGLIKTVNLGVVVEAASTSSRWGFLTTMGILGVLLLVGILVFVVFLARRSQQEKGATA